MKTMQRAMHSKLRVLALLFFCLTIAVTSGGCRGRAWDDSLSPIPITSKDPSWGSRTAPVTLVLYSDFQCPFCAKVTSTVDQLQVTYGKTHLRIVWKNEPLSFHKSARPAAEAGAGVMQMKGSEAFWKFHDHAFKNQQSLTEENFVLWAKDAGVNATTFKAGLATHKWSGKVDTDHDEAKSAGVSGTPCAFVNGVRVSGAQPFEKWKAVIDEEMEKANAEIRSGTRKDRVYVAMSTRNKRAEPPPAPTPAPATKLDDFGDRKDPLKDDTTTVHELPIGTSPILGSGSARVTLVVFSDFQCPFCKRIEVTFDDIRKAYGDKVRFVWKNNPLPFHKNAIPAANFALEARAQKGDKLFWTAHDALFEMQQDLSDQALEGLAAKLGLDVTKTMTAVRDQKFRSTITADTDLAKQVQATGTPVTFVNGRRLQGAQPLIKFTTIIDEELAKSPLPLAPSAPSGKASAKPMPRINLAP